jgi:hypothetical protein
MMPALFAILLIPGADPAIERGRAALTSRAFIPAFWPRPAVERAWTQWGLAAKPADYAAALHERYGLAKAPYPNDGLPMGLRMAPYSLLGRGVGLDCMTCHGSELFGQSIIGLGNASLDIQAMFEDFAAAANMPTKLPFAFSQARGTNEAGAFSVYLLGLRNDDLSLRTEYRDLGLKDDSCEDVPAWWLLKKKSTMYHVGATDAKSVRSIMQFMMHPLSTANDFTAAESAFRDIAEYLRAIEPPKYPFPIDAELAAAGRVLFQDHCAKCHGSYGPEAKYPNRIIPLDEIGTDATRFHNIGPKFGAAYNASWFAKEASAGKPIRPTAGYQAPPLDGVWATAPYFHNGSVPSLAGVLDPAARPRVFTRSFRTSTDDFDREQVGWKVSAPPAALPKSAVERRRIYDTRQPGRGNGGHTYGEALSPAERRRVIEYLKTL